MIEPEACEFAVIGGGVSGLAVAHDLARAGRDVRVLDQGNAPGGCARTVSADGFLFEQGPFNLLVRHPLFEGLLGGLSDDLEVVSPSPSAKRREIIRNGVRCPVPSSLGTAFMTPLLSPLQKLRVGLEPILGKRPTVPDPTLGDLVRRRFGDGMADRVVSAVVAGIFGGDLDRLSARSCFQLLWDLDREHASMVVGLVRFMMGKKKRPSRKWKGMVSFRGGVGSFCEALANRLGTKYQPNSLVTAIEKRLDGFRVHHRSADGIESSTLAQRLVLATDLPAARQLLRPWAEDVAEELDPIQSVSLAVVNAGFNRSAFPEPPEGFGFLVPKSEKDVAVLGVLWASSVFPHQAPENGLSIRIFVGGVRSPEWIDLPESDLVARSLQELRRFIEVREDPVTLSVSRWPEAVPQMVPGHADRIAVVERLVESHHPGLALVGNYLHGVSVNDCVVHARGTAARLLDSPLD